MPIVHALLDNSLSSYFIRPRGRPRTRLRDNIEGLSWSRLGIPTGHLPFVADDRDAYWRLQLEQLPPRPPRMSGSRKVSSLIFTYSFIWTVWFEQEKCKQKL